MTRESMKDISRKRQASSDDSLRPVKQARVEEACDVEDKQPVDVRELELIDSNLKSSRFVFKMGSTPFLIINGNTTEENVGQRVDNDVLDSLEIREMSAKDFFSFYTFYLIWSSSYLGTPTPNFRRDYTLISKIGEGGYGQVFYATRNKDKKIVAVKFFKNCLLKERAHNLIKYTAPHVKMVPTELNALIELRGVKGVVQPYEFYASSSKIYILVMEAFTEAKSLYTYMSERGRLTEEEACHYFRQIVHTLNEMYTRNRHHFDVKDGNIMIDSNTGIATLIDFGGAQRVKRINFKNWISTKSHLPPEYHLEKKFYGIPVESWCLGLILFQMTTGILPISKDAEANSKRDYEAPEELSSDLRSLIKRCLKRNPRSRPNFNEILQSPWVKRMENWTFSSVGEFRQPIPIPWWNEDVTSDSETSVNI